MRNVFDASVNEKSIIECPDFLISILKSPTPQFVENPQKIEVQYKTVSIHQMPFIQSNNVGVGMDM